jgi:hypothetical protein
MAETKLISFTYQEVAECLARTQNLTEGIWGLYVRFGLQAANVGPTPENVSPAAFVSVVEIGLQKMDAESNITINAAKLNLKKTSRSRTKGRTKS